MSLNYKKEQIIEDSLALVPQVAVDDFVDYMRTSDPDELISVGSIGLIKAVNAFEESAKEAIRREIKNYLKKQGRLK